MRRTEHIARRQRPREGQKRLPGAGALLRTALLAILTVCGFRSQAQCPLVCNDAVNVSLPGPSQNCAVTVTPDMVMEDPPIGCQLIVTIMDLQGNVLPTSPTVNDTHIGQTFVYSVDDGQGNSCWGTLTVEDKLGPEITNCNDLTILCLQNTDPDLYGGDAAAPDFDDCSGGLIISFQDSVLQGTCDDTLAAVIHRTWSATDGYGNLSTCIQVIEVKRVTLADTAVVKRCPPNRTLECDADDPPSTDPKDTGFPTLEVDGTEYEIVPGADGYCQLAASYTDEVFELCGGGQKILRTWTIYDWCLPATAGSGNPFSCIQVIKIEDSTAPTLLCPGTIVQGSVSSACSASVVLPPATVVDGCSGVSVKVHTPFGVVNGNGGPLLNVPVGEHSITYIATDDCGNVASCSTTLIVEDDTPPVVVCDEHTTASLTIDGSAIVAAESFDDGSSDNCGIAEFKVRRMPSSCNPNGTPFEDFVSFDCCDLGQTIMVELRVYDAAGNYNSCMVDVFVQDKIPPTITCPPKKVIECYDPIPAAVAPIISDNCPGATWTHQDDVFINSCGVGTVFRTYTVTDAAGLTASCQQVIQVVNNDPFDESDIVWPQDFDIFTCGAPTDPDDLPAGHDRPLITEDACDLVAVTYEDQFLPISPPACYKILRKWIVIDWCQFNPNDPTNGGSWEFVQVIKVHDVDKPVLTCPGDVVFTSTQPDCGPVFVPIDTIGVQDCSPEWVVNYTVDFFGNGTIDRTGQSLNPSGQYPTGTHVVEYIVEDKCGNTSTCSFTVTVLDGKKPTPVCVNGLAVELMPDPNGNGGMIVLDPELFNKGSYDNCTDPEDLILTLTPNTFTCDELGTNIVTLWVTDQAGNSDFCETYVIIQDNMGFCQGNNVVVGGAIQTEEGEGVQDVMVDISGNGPAVAPVKTDTEGQFLFAGLQPGYDYSFTPVLDQFPLNGVTTFDLVLIQRHILGTVKLDSPYKIIAADANNSGSVTTLDMVELRKLILQTIPTFGNNTSWRFIDKDFVFPNPANPFQTPFPELLNFNNLSADELAADFVAVKVGDVNGSAVPNLSAPTVEERYAGTLPLHVPERRFQAGEEVRLPVRVGDVAGLMGMQFTLRFDADILTFQGVEPAALPQLSEENFGTRFTNEGLLTFSWNAPLDAPEGTALTAQQELFTLRFVAQAGGTISAALALHDLPGFTPPEAYRLPKGAAVSQAETLDLELQFDGAMSTTDGVRLWQNVPNPFRDQTTVAFYLPQAGPATLSVVDLAGRVVHRIEADFSKGMNQITLQNQNLGAPGIYYLRLESPDGIAVRKMVME